MSSLCLLCGKGILIEKDFETVCKCLGQEHIIKLHFSQCSVCRSEQANSDQLQRNKKNMKNSSCILDKTCV